MGDARLNLVQLKLRDYGKVLLTRDQGEPVRDELLLLVNSYDTVEIDLNGVDAFTPSFIDEALGKCLEEIGAARFRQQVKLVVASIEHRKLVNLVLKNRAANKS